MQKGVWPFFRRKGKETPHRRVYEETPRGREWTQNNMFPPGVTEKKKSIEKGELSPSSTIGKKRNRISKGAGRERNYRSKRRQKGPREQEGGKGN